MTSSQRWHDRPPTSPQPATTWRRGNWCGCEGNRWSLFAPGTTTFLPVVEHSFFLINVLLSLMDEKTAMGMLDDRRMFLPAGVGHLMRSKGGHLDDDPTSLRTIPLSIGERITS